MTAESSSLVNRSVSGLEAPSGASTTASAMARATDARRAAAQRSIPFDFHHAHGIDQINPLRQSDAEPGPPPAPMVYPITPDLTKQICGQSAPNVATLPAPRRTRTGQNQRS